MVNPRDLSRPHVWQPSLDVANSKTLLLLHGSGADEHDLLGLGKALDPNANLLSPRGLRKSDGANRFFALLEQDTYDEKAVIENSAELADFLWAAAGEYGFNPNNVYAVGFSNGANAATSLLLLQPDSVAGVVAMGNNKVFDDTPFKKGKPDLSGKRVWIANGATDAYSPQVRVDALIEEFKSLGAKVEFLLHPAGHTISMDHVRQIASELAQIS
jgi:phospholipase/carboxylesterase